MAIGSIVNNDPLQEAWIARFGRTVASQVVDAIGDRLARDTSEVRIAGHSFEPSGGWTRDEQEAESTTTLDMDGLSPTQAPTALDPHALMTQSSFQMTRGSADEIGGAWTTWGRFSFDSFEHEADELRMEANVRTGIVGADIARGRWLAGAALGVSEGKGPYTHGSGDTGEVSGEQPCTRTHATS